MDPQTLATLATIALFAAPIAGIVAAIIAARVQNRTSRVTGSVGHEANEIDRFEAFMRASEDRIGTLEKRITELEKKDVTSTQRIAELTEENETAHHTQRAQARYIRKLLLIIARIAPDYPTQPDVEDAPYITMLPGVSPPSTS